MSAVEIVLAPCCLIVLFVTTTLQGLGRLHQVVLSVSNGGREKYIRVRMFISAGWFSGVVERFLVFVINSKVFQVMLCRIRESWYLKDAR